MFSNSTAYSTGFIDLAERGPMVIDYPRHQHVRISASIDCKAERDLRA